MKRKRNQLQIKLKQRQLPRRKRSPLKNQAQTVMMKKKTLKNLQRKLQLLPKVPKKRKVQTPVALILKTRMMNLLRKRQRSKKRLQRTMMINLWLKKAVLILQTKVSIKVLQAEVVEAQEVEVTEVEDVVAAEAVVTNLVAAGAASNAAKKAIFHENAPTNQQVAAKEWAVTANVLNVVNKVISQGNAPRVVPINVSDARKKAILVGIALRVEVTTASIVTNLVTCPEIVHKRGK